MVMVLFAYCECVDDAIAGREQVRSQDLDAKALFGLSFAEDDQLLHGSGPPPRTFRCHSSPIV
jgi:hypothetical protein